MEHAYDGSPTGTHPGETATLRSSGWSKDRARSYPPETFRLSANSIQILAQGTGRMCMMNPLIPGKTTSRQLGKSSAASLRSVDIPP